MLRVQIGAGARAIDGFVNMDPRPKFGHVTGHACAIPFGAGTVDVLFANAVFEHLYLVQQLLAAEEWARVLAPDGVIVTTGLPDFAALARLYLEAGPGVTRDTFDLRECYRYTHGCPEMHTHLDWSRWSPAEHLDDAPPEWLPQLHKGLFDAPTVTEMFERTGLSTTVLRYCYPGVSHLLNLAVVAGHTPRTVADLERVPGIDEYVDLATCEEAT